MGVLIKDGKTIHFIMGSHAEILIWSARDDSGMGEGTKKYILPMDANGAEGLAHRLLEAVKLVKQSGIEVADPVRARDIVKERQGQPRRRRKK